MKLEIYKQEKSIEKQPVRLALEKTSEGISVIAVDEHGNPIPAGYLIRFKWDGTVLRNTNVSEELGFQFDNAGRIIETEE